MNISHVLLRDLMLLPHEVLAERVLQAEEKLARACEQMIDVREVACIMGQSVSWVRNSSTQKARKLRRASKKYGEGPKCAVRWKRGDVIAIRDSELEHEAEAHQDQHSAAALPCG